MKPAASNPSQTALAPPPWMRWIWLALALAGAAVMGLLAHASANSDLLSRYYTALIVTSFAIVIALAILVIHQIALLLRARRARVFGSRLTTRMMAFFAVVAVLPGVVVYAISVTFLTSSIESFFDTRIERALDAGLQLGRSALNEPLKELTRKAQTMAQRLAVHEEAASARQALIRLRDEHDVAYAALLSSHGAVLAVAAESPALALAPSLTAQETRPLRPLAALTSVEPSPDGGLQFKVLTAVASLSLGPLRTLLVTQPVPAQLREQTALVDTGYREYQELAFQRSALLRLFALTLTLTLLLALLAALALAALFSERLAGPMADLAAATRAVADGDFSVRAAVRGRDELAVLGNAFNTMTEQLAQARSRDAANQQVIAQANLTLENILRNLKAGVLVLTDDFTLLRANAASSVILQARTDDAVGQPLPSPDRRFGALDHFAEILVRAFSQSQDGDWQREQEMMVAGHARSLIIRGTRRELPGGAARIVVFDDITEVLHAERDTAWAEVARRLAHEIKNPLTPIQLSAERLAMKLAPRLDADAAAVLERATQTIVNQVTAMKHMVNDFAVYARKPRPGSMQPLDVEALLRETIELYGAYPLRLELAWNAEDRFIRAEATRLRQVFHNLLTNAADACSGLTEGRLQIRAENRQDAEGIKELALQFCDNGPGFSAEVLRRAFEPYVTTKAKGTGLGLAIVKKIVDEHKGRIMIDNISAQGQAASGARVSLFFPVFINDPS